MQLVEFECQGFIVTTREQFDTDDKVDLIIGHARYPRLWSRYARAIRAKPVSREDTDFAARFAALDLHPEAASIMVATAPMLATLCAATTSQASDQLDKFITTNTTVGDRDNNPLWYMDEPGIPVVVAEGLLASHRSLVALHVLDFGRRLTSYGVSDHDLCALAQLFATSVRKYLTLVASATESLVPTEIIPTAERIDLAAAGASQRAALSTAEAILRAGAR